MTRLRHILTFALLAALAPVLAHSQAFTTVTATIQNGHGGVLAGGSFCAQPYTGNTPTTITPAGGSPSTGPFCTPISAQGVVTATNIPNLATASPTGLNYTVIAYNSVGAPVLTWYGLLNIAGADTVNLNAYTLTFPVPTNAWPSASGLGVPYLACAPGATYTQTDVPTAGYSPNNGWACQTALAGYTQWLQAGSVSPAPGPNLTATIPVVAQMIADAIKGGGVGTPAGTNTDIQYNGSGAFGADPGQFTYNSTTHSLNVAGVMNWARMNGAQYGVDTFPGGIQGALDASTTTGGVAQLSSTHIHLTTPILTPSNLYNGHTVRGYGKTVSDLGLTFTGTADFPFIDETQTTVGQFLTAFDIENVSMYGALATSAPATGGSAPCVKLASDTFHVYNSSFQGCGGAVFDASGNVASNGLFLDTDMQTNGTDGFRYVGPTPIAGNQNSQGATDMKFFGGLNNFNTAYGVYVDNTGRDAIGDYLFNGAHFESNGFGSYRFKWMDDINVIGSYFRDNNQVIDVGSRNAHHFFNEMQENPYDQGGMYNVAGWNSYAYALGGSSQGLPDNAGPGALRNKFPMIEDYLDTSEVTDWDMTTPGTGAWTAGTGATIVKSAYTSATTGQPWLVVTCSSSPCSASQVVTDKTGGSHWLRVVFQTGDQSAVPVNLAEVVVSNSGGTLVDSGGLQSWGGPFTRNDQSWETAFQSSTGTYTLTLTCNSTAVPCLFTDIRDVQDYISNPGFELGGSGNQPTSWTPTTAGTPCILSSSQAHTGTYSMHCTGTSINIRQAPTFTSGDYYLISAWEYITPVSGPGGPAYFGYGDMHDGSNQNGVYINVKAKGRTDETGVWTKVSFVVQMTNNFGIALGSALAGIDTYLDDVQAVHLNLDKQNGDKKGVGTYTAATSDAITVPGVVPSSLCVFSPTNALAAASTAAAYISAVAGNLVTITHVATSASGGTVNITCK